jgi:hypothetical protein
LTQVPAPTGVGTAGRPVAEIRSVPVGSTKPSVLFAFRLTLRSVDHPAAVRLAVDPELLAMRVVADRTGLVVQP